MQGTKNCKVRRKKQSWEAARWASPVTEGQKSALQSGEKSGGL